MPLGFGAHHFRKKSVPRGKGSATLSSGAGAAVEPATKTTAAATPKKKKKKRTYKAQMGWSAREIKEHRAVFKAFDKDNDGEVTVEELTIAVQRMEHNVTDDQAKMLVALIDTDHNGKITFPEFLQSVTLARKQERGDKLKTPVINAYRNTSEFRMADGLDRVHASIDTDADGVLSLAEITAAFNVCNLDNDDVITVHELGAAIRLLGQNPTEQELMDMVRSADVDASGALSLEEFHHLMTQKREAAPRTEGATMRAAFNIFDTDGSGTISAAELREGLIGSGDMMPASDVDELLAMAVAERNSGGAEGLPALRGAPRRTASVQFKDFAITYDEFERLLSPKTVYSGVYADA